MKLSTLLIIWGLVVALLIFSLVFIAKMAIQEVSKTGLKNIVEDIWYGEEEDSR